MDKNSCWEDDGFMSKCLADSSLLDTLIADFACQGIISHNDCLDMLVSTNRDTIVGGDAF